MKNILILLAITFLTSQFCWAQSNNFVSNVDWKLDDSEEQIIITYDLLKDGNKRYFDVLIKVNIEGNEFTPQALSGDVGNYIKAEKGKKIIWNVFNDVTELSGELEILVIAKSIGNEATTQQNKPQPMPKAKKKKTKVPIYAGLGGVVVLGGGLMYQGSKQMTDAKTLYDDVYAANTDPTAPVYSLEYSTTRSQFYENVNNDYRKGSIFLIGGGAIIVAGGAILIKRLIDLNRINADISVNPYYELASPEIMFAQKSDDFSGEIGLAMKYNF